MLDWYEACWSNPTQNVVMKEQSCIEIVNIGVSQGSMLGPLLFLTYINDIVRDIGSIIKLIVDDTSMSPALRDPQLRGETLNSDVEKMNEWAKLWKVKFNERTELVNFAWDQSPC